MHKCKVIAIANQKGGVGKTTTAASLGVGLVRQGKKVMLIDADPQGSLSLSLGIEKPDNLESTIANVMERIVEDKEIEPGFAVVQTKEGIDLMPANIELSGIEVRLVNEMSRERVLKRYVDSKRQDYDFIIIDCMVAEVYSHIIDEDRRFNAQKFEEQFYQTKGLRNVEEGQTVPMPSFSSATELKKNETSETEELVTKLLNNPEALSLLKAIANKL